jgi:hypothetical protein
MKNADDEKAATVQNEISSNANKQPLDFEDAEVVEEEVLQIDNNRISESEKNQIQSYAEMADKIEEVLAEDLIDGPTF